MKKLITIILLALAMLPQANYAQTQGTKGAFVPNVYVDPQTGVKSEFFNKSYALIIANWDYTHGWEDMPRIKDEAIQLNDSLYSIGFDSVIIVWNLNSTQIIDKINTFIRKFGSAPSDRLLIYYTGHGQVTFDGEYETGFIVPVDAPIFYCNANFDKLDAWKQSETLKKQYTEYKKSQSNFESNAVSFEVIKTFVSNMTSKHALLVFDCCFGGQAISKGTPMTLEVRKAVQNRSIEILSAGNKAQQVPVISQFLKYFLLAITGSDPTADNYRDGYLQTSELFLYLGTKVKDATNGDEPKYGHLKEKWENGGFVFELPWAGKTMPGTPPGISETPTGSKTKVLKSPYISDMVLVEGGTFTMGSNEGQENEKPPHPVTLSDYYICMKEITQKEWRNIMGASTSLSNPSYNKGCDDCPVEQVNWLDVQEFINKLNEKTNLTYRLPTEAEWEYAARGGKYSKGNEYSGGNMIVDVAWCSDNSGGKTHPVGKKRPNELGIYDMSGNVYEWCYDWYDANFYANNKKTKDPCNTTASQYRVIRGGSWGTGPDYCRVAYRLGNTPDGRYDPVGFRLVLVP